jgi:predicted DNA-binding transcriptional regulator AlpA
VAPPYERGGRGGLLPEGVRCRGRGQRLQGDFSIRHAGKDRIVSAPLAHVRPVPRRGLSRDEAAMYCGISATLFDRLVADGRMPCPCRIDGRKVWDIRAIDVAFDELPRENARPKSSWDDA